MEGSAHDEIIFEFYCNFTSNKGLEKRIEEHGDYRSQINDICHKLGYPLVIRYFSLSSSKQYYVISFYLLIQW